MNYRVLTTVLTITGVLLTAVAGAEDFNGLDMNLGNLHRLSNARTRSISAENFTGEKGRGGMATEGLGAEAARDLGQGWKVSPAVRINSGETFEVANIEGPGAIQHIWVTPQNPWRYLIFRIYWDGEKEPSVECPIGDFFACGWNRFAQVSSIPVAVNPGSAFNCYWVMPFRKSCRITVENIADERDVNDGKLLLFYQVDYTLTEVPGDAAYFHAQFRRTNPLPYKEVYTIVDGIKGHGHYVGTYMCWGVNNNGWWGEGEIKFYLDGDKKFPTICGTGTEDYFLGSYCFKVNDKYTEYTTPFAGMPQVIRPDGEYSANTRFGLYRWHIMDPVRFEKDMKVTIQALSWRSGGRYLPLQDDIASVAYWYQTEPHAPFPKLPDKDYLEIQ
ncbi:glycoside hydrolase family 172 protein [Candidatus Latescibacterota bacterium]